MTDYKVGDKVKVTFEGTIAQLNAHDGCLKVKDGNGELFSSYSHYIYAHSARVKIEVTKPAEPEFPDGLYQDRDGELIVRRDGKWRDCYGEDRGGIGGMATRLKRVETPFESPWI